jgi:poly-gamma-glutamate synthesis protein (capsule biosynthesis protein)
MNDIPIPKSWMVNLIDTLKIREDILSAKKISDFAIIALHFGTEYERYPNREQKQLVQKIIGYGANMIIGSHPHVIQPVDKIDNVFIAYSLGNFLCGQRMQFCDAGMMLKYTIVKHEDSTYLEQISYIPTWTAKYEENNYYKFKILLLTDVEMTNKEKYLYLSDDNLSRMKQVFNETTTHINNPQINFIIKE